MLTKYDLPNPFMFDPERLERFKLDVEAFMDEMTEPPPLFLQGVEDDIRDLLRSAA